MYLIKGYNVHEKITTKHIETIRFSSFSNLICNSEKDLAEFRIALEDKVSQEKKKSVTIVFMFYEMHHASKDAKIMREFLEGKTVKQISEILDIQEDDVEFLLMKYIKGIKI